MKIPGEEYIRDSACCQDLMERDIGTEEDGRVVSVMRCVACGREYPEPREWDRQAVRRRVKKARRWLSVACYEGDCGNCTAPDSCPCPHHQTGPLDMVEAPDAAP